MKTLLALLTVLVAGLVSAVPPLSPKEETTAKKLYLGKCAKCHKLYNPAGYTDERWRQWMVKMTKKAKLSAEEERLLTSYITEIIRGRGPTQGAEGPK